MEKEPKKQLGESLRKARMLRGEKGISTAAAAQKHGKDFKLSQATISRYESGKMWPTLPRLITLARTYKTPVAVFLKAIGATDEEIGIAPAEVKVIPYAQDRVVGEVCEDIALLVSVKPNKLHLVKAMVEGMLEDAGIEPQSKKEA